MTAPTPNQVASHLQGALDLLAPIAGDRKELAGYATTDAITNSATTTTITKSSADYTEIDISGAATLAFTAATAGEAATKVIKLTATATTTLTVSGATWSSGSAPTWGSANAVLILVASFFGSAILLSVFYNSEA